jgi:tripartite-type tricarboxylate transporter receptor subunit TctC
MRDAKARRLEGFDGHRLNERSHQHVGAALRRTALDRGGCSCILPPQSSRGAGMTSGGGFARNLARAVLVAGALVAAAPSAVGGEYPEKPIRLFLPFPAGGAVDIVARVVTSRMAEQLGRPFVIENRAGAGGVIATDATAKAAPDGYTLLLTSPNHTINAALNSKLPYDSERDLAPISIVAEVPELLVSHPSAPFTSFAGFVDYARKNPGKLNYASAGNGTLPHVTMELLLRRTGISVAHIPYRGAAPAMTDLLAGQVQVKMDTYTTSAPLIADGRLRALAIASRARAVLLPDVPTIAEMGVAGYEGILWIGLMAPAGTPKPIIDKLAGATRDAVHSPATAARLEHDGVDIGGSTTEAFAALIAKEIVQWRDLAQSARITLD